MRALLRRDGERASFRVNAGTEIAIYNYSVITGVWDSDALYLGILRLKKNSPRKPAQASPYSGPAKTCHDIADHDRLLE